jgi:hypothetical protein
VHDAARIRLVCRAHNQHAADQLYGRVFMERLRESRRAEKAAHHGPAPEHLAGEVPIRPEGESVQRSLF